LGIRPTYDGLKIEPVIPANWDAFEAQRIYRGVRYEIKASRQGPGNQVRLEVDGHSIKGITIPIPPADTQVVSVKVMIGEP
jgi:cellobiose phosphorylase